jgi:16S rRNA G527 N7-methylase RsmG
MYDCKDKFVELIKLFKDRNDKINLSAIRDDEGIKIKHIRDSLIILSDDFLNEFIQLKKIFNKNLKVADVWTWWGFPLY